MCKKKTGHFFWTVSVYKLSTARNKLLSPILKPALLFHNLKGASKAQASNCDWMKIVHSLPMLNPIMNWHVDVLIVYNDVAQLWHPGKEPHIGIEPQVEKEHCVTIQEISEVGFEGNMCLSINQ